MVAALCFQYDDTSGSCRPRLNSLRMGVARVGNVAYFDDVRGTYEHLLIWAKHAVNVLVLAATIDYRQSGAVASEPDCLGRVFL
jgi:hypothetical protein